MNRRLIGKWAGLAMRALDSDWKKCPRQEIGLECPGIRCYKGPHRAMAYTLKIQEAMHKSLQGAGKSLK